MNNKKISVCFLTRYPVYPLLGGVERVTANLSDVFDAHGIGCTFLSLKENPNPECVPAGKTAVVLPRKNRAAFFENFLRERSVNVVIWQQGGSHPFPFPKICKRMEVKVISCSHGQPDYYRHSAQSKACGIDSVVVRGLWKKLRLFFKLKWKDFYHRRVFIHNTRCSSAYVLLSDRYTSSFRAYFKGGFVPCLLKGIGNVCSFSHEDVDVREKEKELLFVGRLSVTDKRPDYLLRIWSKLEARFPDWTLRLVGSGTNEKELKAFAKSLGLKRVFFEGFGNPVPFYRRASIFCMTSALEGFPMVLLEATQFGCVPVAFDSFAAVCDVISDGVNGFCVPAFDLDVYAETLAKTMSNNELREKLAREAQRIAVRYSPNHIGEKWVCLFEQILKGTSENE